MPAANTALETLVFGGTGTIGSRVVKDLREKGVPVRPLSRSTTPSFFWDDPETWKAALEGADRAFILHPELLGTESGQQITRLAHAAAAAGVKRLVLLSGLGADDLVKVAEEGVKSSGAEWTILRPSWFDQDFQTNTMPGFREGIMSGKFETVLGSEVHGFIDADDIDAVAAAVLTEPGHDGKTYDLSGPRLLSIREAVGEIANALDRNIEFVNLTPQQLRAAHCAGRARGGRGLAGHARSDGQGRSGDRGTGGPRQSAGEFRGLRAAGSSRWSVGLRKGRGEDGATPDVPP